MKTIFLDFDGVLHVIQANFEERFSKLYLLEDLAKDFSFEVVISSTWRLFYDVSSLKEKGFALINEMVSLFNGMSIDKKTIVINAFIFHLF